MTNNERLKVRENLLQAASDASDTRWMWGSLTSMLFNVKWEKLSKIHDWRNYVDPSIRGVWNVLSDHGRIAVYIGAVKQASTENWD